VFNSGATDQGFLARGEFELGKGLLGASWQSDFGRDIGRPRNNSNTVRFYYPSRTRTASRRRTTCGRWAGSSA